MSTCRYDCSENPGTRDIPEYSDISGIGVIVGYTAPAGLAIIIIVAYYFLAHQPDLDPFRKEGEAVQTPNPYVPHPVDRLVLNFAGTLLKRIFRTQRAERSWKKARLQRALLKCILTMSDLQLVTGLSILISGYFQLRCGLSVYYWQLLVSLTWFCSVTHLSCLTFLRKYLNDHPGKRSWRLVGMGVLTVMLIVAYLPTGNNGVGNHPADYAICTFRRLGPISPQDTSTPWDGSTILNYTSMIISVLLMGFGFIFRIIKLSRGLSVSVIAASRAYVSARARRILRRWYEQDTDDLDGVALRKMKLKQLFRYRLALAVFLTIRAILDLWSSLFFEVWWLIASFLWGTANLASSMRSDSHKNVDKGNWSFGQIAPVILLLVPILSMMELLFEPHGELDALEGNDATRGESPTFSSRSEKSDITASTLSMSSERPYDHPDHDFYQDAWYQSMVSCLLFGMIANTIMILSLYFVGYTKVVLLQVLIPSIYVINWPPVVIILCTFCFVTNSLVLKDLGADTLPLRAFMWFSSFGVSSILLFFKSAIVSSGAWISFSILAYLALSGVFLMKHTKTAS